MKYQFQLDGRGAAPIRKEWEVAAHDAVLAGYASWAIIDPGSIKLDSNLGASIERIEE